MFATSLCQIVRSVTAGTNARGYSRTMEMKFYAQFSVDDIGSNSDSLFSGIVELREGQIEDVSPALLERVLADNFQIDADSVQLVTWSRLH